jgi:ankyrin repeat protein
MKAELIAIVSAVIAFPWVMQGQTPDLYLAARTNNVKLAEVLIDQKVDISVAILLDNGAKINSADVNGATALLYAVEFGRTSVVKLLMARHADPFLKDKRGFDAFYLAQQLDDPTILGILKQLPKAA